MLEDLYTSPNDFIIHISPIFLKEGEWSGQVEIDIAYDEDNTLNKENFEILFTLTNLICSSVPFFSQHPEIMSLAKSYLDKSQKHKEEGNSIADILHQRFDKDTLVKGNFTKNSNVIHMNFKNKED